MPQPPVQQVDVEAVLDELTLDEKIQIVAGKNNWNTHGFARLHVPETLMCDGPVGLRKNVDLDDMDSGTVPATCFPCSALMASSWNRDLLTRVGSAIADEGRREHVDLLLGPGNNIKRSPLCGRNFEYFSEDPCLSGEMAGAFVRGVQCRGVGATVKHFCCNNQETLRMSIDARVDERALRELYFAGFERVIKGSRPWCVMASYNRVNGEYAVSSKHLLTEVLREQWGFNGMVMSDWGATDDRNRALSAGMDLEMPGTQGPTEKLLHQLAARGELDLAGLRNCARCVLKHVNRALAGRAVPERDWDFEEHDALARAAAAESVVLLTNTEHALPLKTDARVAVIGAFAEVPQFQGGGSAHVNQTHSSITLDEMRKLGGSCNVTYPVWQCQYMQDAWVIAWRGPRFLSPAEKGATSGLTLATTVLFLRRCDDL